MILGLLHDRGTYTSGLGYLLLYNLIFISPLVIILGLASQPELHSVVKSWRRANSSRLELVGNLLLIAIGLVIFLL